MFQPVYFTVSGNLFPTLSVHKHIWLHVFSTFFWKKLEEITFFQFLPFFREETYFFRNFPNPALKAYITKLQPSDKMSAHSHLVNVLDSSMKYAALYKRKPVDFTKSLACKAACHSSPYRSTQILFSTIPILPPCDNILGKIYWQELLWQKSSSYVDFTRVKIFLHPW